jgi:hypothetical protein
MKKIFYRLILILVVPVMFFSSCDLEEKPMTTLTAGGYYDTKAGVETLVSGIYDKVRGIDNPTANLHRMNIFGTDTEFAGEGYDGDGLGWYDVNAEHGSFSSVWNDMYSLINYCNYAIKYVPIVDGYLDSERTDIEAQARLFRAYAYYHLTMQFGDVHFSLEASEGAATESNRTPVATIWDEGIYPDLRYAVANLPATVELGRLSAWAAKFFLGYVLLSDSRGTVTHWNEAAGLFKDIIDNGGFTLMSPEEVFKQDNDASNTEVIFATRTLTQAQYGGNNFVNQSHMYYLGAYHQYGNVLTRYDGNQLYGKAWCRYRIATWLIDTYDETIDSRYEAYYRDMWLCNFSDIDSVSRTYTLHGEKNTVWIKGKLGDTALYCPKHAWTMEQIQTHPKIIVLNPDNSEDYNLRIKGTIDSLDDLYFHANRSNYCSMKKFDDRKKQGGDNDSNGIRHDVLFRLAEAYLLASEANLRAGNAGEALTYFNVIRRNAAYPGKESAMEYSSVTINDILDERGRELCGEGYRWTDLKRLGVLPERAAMNYHVSTKGFGPTKDGGPKGVWDNKYMLRPIPQSHIDRCTSDYPQNPGW